MYEQYRQTALIYSDGDWQKSDYFLNCNWFEYYDRLVNMKKYYEAKRAANEKNKNVSSSQQKST